MWLKTLEAAVTIFPVQQNTGNIKNLWGIGDDEISTLVLSIWRIRRIRERLC